MGEWIAFNIGLIQQTQRNASWAEVSIRIRYQIYTSKYDYLITYEMITILISKWFPHSNSYFSEE